MRRLLWLIPFYLLSLSAWAQYSPVQGFCEQGATAAKTQGLNSTNYLNGVIPSCTITAYLTGTSNLATIYSAATGGTLSNPFTATALGSTAPGYWIFYAATNAGLDVSASGGILPNVYAQPTPLLIDVTPGGGGGGGGGPCSTPGAVEVATNPCVPNINETVTTGNNGSLQAGPVPSGSTVVSSTSYGLYGGLPTIMNVMTDCQKLTGLAVTGLGDPSHDDWAAIQACIWQREGICAIGSGVCTPTDNRFSHTGSTSVTFKFPQRQFNQSFGAGGLTPPVGTSAPASYYFSQSLDLPWGTDIEGDGSGQSGNGTTLWFAAGAGMYHRGFGKVAHFSLVGSSCWSNASLATFVLPTGWGGSGPAVSGLSIGSAVTVDDMMIRCFDMHGIAVDSGQAWPPPDTSNQSDLVHISNVTTFFNRGSGFYFHGGDGGVGHCDRCTAQQNQLYGAYESSTYQDQITAYLGDGNHTDGTGYSGSVPAITSVSCTSGTLLVPGVCTFTTSTTHNLNPGDCVALSGFHYAPLNAHFCEPGLASASGATFTLPNPDIFADSETGSFVAAYSLGEHVWAAAGNTTPGTNATGGCMYGAQGSWMMPYCEADQPIGTFINPDVVGIQGSIVYTPIGNVPNGPVGSGVQQGNDYTIVKGLYDLPYNAASSVRLDATDEQGAILATFINNFPITASGEQIGGVYSKSYLRRTFTGPGLNPIPNNSNWNCFGLPNGFSGSMAPFSGCFGDQSTWQITACTFTNGGTGYTSPVISAHGDVNGQGAGATFSFTNTGGVLSACTVVNPGAGYQLGATATVYDSTGTGATVTLTASITGAPTDTGRSALNADGFWFMPNWFGLGNLGNYQPQIVIGTCTAAPSSGSWKIGDTCINSAPTAGGIWGWQNTVAGTPGTWTPLIFAGSGFTGTKVAGSCTLTIAGGIITNVTGC